MLKADKGGDTMPTTDKELNCYLLDQLELIERLETIAQKSNAT
jgi:hypothetical protein